MQPILKNYEQHLGAVLVCNNCGSEYLHHERVEVFERDEDAKDGLHVDVD